MSETSETSETLVGGKQVAQGTYSCIFSPPLRCASGAHLPPTKPRISKVMDKKHALEEWDLSKKIQVIPHWRNYFSVSEKEPCLVEEAHAKKYADVCDLINDTPSNKLYSLQLYYAGKTLKQYAMPPEFNIKHFMVHILEAAALLAVHNIIHNDLHDLNIVIDSHMVPRIIDFNVSMVMTGQITTNELVHDYKHSVVLPQVSPDYVGVLGVYYNKSSRDIVSDIATRKSSRDMYRVLSINPYQGLRDISQLFNVDCIKQGNLMDWYNKHWTKIDSYSIGMYFITLLKTRSLFQPIIKAFRDPTIRRVITQLCEVNPTKRWDCMRALRELHPTSIIIRTYGKEWFVKHT